MSEIAELYRSGSYSHRVAAEVRAHASREIAGLLGHSSAEISRVYKLISMRKLADGVERAARRLTDVRPPDDEEMTA